ncbi:MAG: hypothetical protein RLZZ618_667 [Pseudomonadota bacterium]
MTMPWIWLALAGLLEVGWAVGLKYTEGFTRPTASVLTVAGMIASVALLGLAMRHLPLSTAYAVWTGIGTLGTVIFGMVVMGDSVTAWRLACAAMILLGIAGLKLST